jgi:hypothetical protein
VGKNATIHGGARRLVVDHRQLLRADCARCQGLCCVSLPFDRSESFSFDKAADEPCRNLEATHRCAIHARLVEAGHTGCARYDCYGAGQRVVQELYPGRSWRSDARLASAMFAAFRSLRDVHELRWLLYETARLPLSPAQAAERERLLSVLEPSPGLGAQALAELDVTAAHRTVHAFLRSLAPCAQRGPTRRRLPLAR